MIISLMQTGFKTTAAVLLAVISSSQIAAGETTPASPLIYQAHFEAEFNPEKQRVLACIRVEQPGDLLKRLQFTAAADRYRVAHSDGRVRRNSEGFSWRPDRPEAALCYYYRVDNRHDPDSGYDALMTAHWAILRADDLFPPVAVRSITGAKSVSTLFLRAPANWVIETPYGGIDNEPIVIRNEQRRFDRPTGWLALGELGTRHETSAGRSLTVAAPLNSGFRRMDVLAMLRWTLPELIEVFPEFPKHLLVVGSGDPMWRGGLSGPASMFLHAARPLISENGTSTLVHELVHIASRFSSPELDDWIVEGLAEYYSLEVMRRSGTISEERFHRSLGKLASWAERDEVKSLRAKRSQGARTATAVMLLYNLDQEIQRRTASKATLDAVVSLLSEAPRNVTLARLRSATEQIIGSQSQVLATVR